MKKYLQISALLSLALLSACTSKLILQTEPSEAQILISVAGKKEKAKAGQTPLEISEKQLSELLQVGADKTSLLEVTFTKKDFETKTLLIPSNRWGEISKTIKVELAPRTENSDTVKLILRHLFNGKKFAETRQYESAHQEIDSALALESSMAQAMTMKAGVYFLQNNYAQAEVWYKKAIQTDPNYSEAIQMLEKMKQRSGRTEP